jgi:hypothetical protein
LSRLVPVQECVIVLGASAKVIESLIAICPVPVNTTVVVVDAACEYRAMADITMPNRNAKTVFLIELSLGC